MIILGIDPGLATLGYGVIESDAGRLKLIQYGTLTTPAKQPTPMRLRSIFEGMNSLMDIYQPDEVAFEELFFGHNMTTAMMVSAARGAAIITAVEQTEKLYEYTPMQIKLALTGSGSADKKAVQQMVKLLLQMKEIPKPDDAADGIACAVCHIQAGHAREQFRMK